MPANNDKPCILLIVTQDTKEIEGRFLRHCLEEAGCEVVHLHRSRRTLGPWCWPALWARPKDV
jgi:uncharacterized protein (UPF0261 family)